MRLAFAKIGKLILAAVVTGSLVSGCIAPAPTATAVPTIDQATLVAAAVETISAQITEEALRNPTPTSTNTAVPPTATPLPPTDTPVPQPTLPPTETPTQAAALSAQFLYATTYPENKREYVPNEMYGLALGFLNNGTVTWQQGYKLKIVNYKGEITVQQEVELGQNIGPGQKVEFNLWAFGSEMLGDHQWVFQIYTAEGYPVPGGVGFFSYKSV